MWSSFGAMAVFRHGIEGACGIGGGSDEQDEGCVRAPERFPVCSPTSSLLWKGLTSPARSSSAGSPYKERVCIARFENHAGTNVHSRYRAYACWLPLR
jgi:hypothetical protein